MLRDWKVRYDERALSHTIVPAHFRLFLRQQLRWKRSWTRESLIVGALHLAEAPARLPVGVPRDRAAADRRRSSPAARSPGCRSLAAAGAPFVYLIGIYAMALVYGLYYGLRHGRYDTLWVFGVLFVFFYLAFLLWQTYYAILTARNSSWGTRPSRAAPEARRDVTPREALRRRGCLPAAAAVAGSAVLRACRGCAARATRPRSSAGALPVPAIAPDQGRARHAGARCRPPRARCRCSPTTASTTAPTTTRSASAQFAEQMEMLERAGFQTISIAQYVRFLQGDAAGLPARPILITFDDGRLDSYRGADKVLAAVRVPGHDVRDRRARRGGQRASTSTGTSCAGWRTAAAGTSRSTPASAHVNVALRQGRPHGPGVRLPALPGRAAGLESFDAYRRAGDATTSCGRSARCPSSIPGFIAVELRACRSASYGQDDTTTPASRSSSTGSSQRHFRRCS